MPKQAVKNVFEKLGEQVKDTAKAVASEPGKVAGKIVGEKRDKKNIDSGATEGQVLETSGKGSAAKFKKISQGQLDEKSLLNKKIEQEEKEKRALLKLHRLRLDEEKAYYSRQENEELNRQEQEEAVGEMQEEIQQLERQKERAKEEVLQGTTAGSTGPVGRVGRARKLKGTKERGRSKD